MEWISCLKDLVVIGTAIVASYVAIKGLSTWKSQLKGKDEYELSKRLLLNLYKYKNSFSVVRRPAIFNYEGDSEELESIKDMKELNFKRNAIAYQRRWEKVVDIRNKIDFDLLEAKILFGDKILTLYKPLIDFENILFRTVQDYLTITNPNESADYKKVVQKIYHEEKKSEILYDMRDKDKYNEDIENYVKEIEKYLIPKLKKFGA